MSEQQLPRLLTLEAAARELSFSRRHLYDLIREGRIEAIGRRHGRRVVSSSIERFIAEEQRRSEAARG